MPCFLCSPNATDLQTWRTAKAQQDAINGAWHTTAVVDILPAGQPHVATIEAALTGYARVPAVVTGLSCVF